MNSISTLKREKILYKDKIKLYDDQNIEIREFITGDSYYCLTQG